MSAPEAAGANVEAARGPVLEARGLRKAYGAQLAVENVDLTLEPGEVYGFLGPNGAGKTTTIKMLLGLTRPDSGAVKLFGEDVAHAGAHARSRVGYLPETLSFYKTLNARQTLRFFAELKRVDVAEVDRRLQQVGLGDVGKKQVGAFSKGMIQRLGLAQALLGDPPFLLLDEPTTGLDPTGARQFKDLLRALNANGTTLFFSSHILSEVQEIATRVGVIQRGKIIAEDSVAALRSRLAMRGQLTLVLEHPPPSGLEAVVSRVEGVESAALEVDRLVVVCDPGVRWKVAQAVEQAGGRIRDLETKDASLEDVFVKLTGGGA
ncbi:MAG: ABC transporter ATP-binding protein [Thermoplasmatota archaeon]